MTFVSVTRLRLRGARFFLPFLWHTTRARAQVKTAEGCLSNTVRRTAGGTYWTLTTWRDEGAMRAYMTSGAHMKAMPKLKHWCDEAAVAHWTQGSTAISWTDAEQRLAQSGRLSKVLYPSPAQSAGRTMGSS